MSGKKYYYNPDVLDGTQWNLEVKFINEVKVLKYGGSNYFPDDFARFKKFIKKLSEE